MQSGNFYFGGESENPYFAQYNFGNICAQSRNLDKVRISIGCMFVICLAGKIDTNTFQTFTN